jgi:hypothetical protein
MQSNVPAELQEFSEQPFRQLAANRAWHQAAHRLTAATVIFCRALPSD